LIVPLKAKRDDQSFVPVSAYYTLCPHNTVLRGHRVRVIQYYADTVSAEYCNTRTRHFREYLCEIKIFRKTVLACSLGAQLELIDKKIRVKYLVTLSL